jgi:tetratricopeptide (TPR) repeat protein
MRWAQAALLLVACATAPPSSPSPKANEVPAPAGVVEHRHYGSPPETLAKWAQTLWPQMQREVDYPRVVEDQGTRTLEHWPDCDGEPARLISEGETHFQRGEYEAAAERYQAALARSPRCYVALMYLGDCAWKRNDPRGALVLYEKGIALNPDAFLLHYFRGDALLAIGRSADARKSYVQALVLRPRRPSVLNNVRHAAGRLGVVVRDEPFLPHAGISQNGDHLDVDFDDGPWRAYAICKASTRLKQRDQWSVGEEETCLGSLLEAYHAAASAPDPALDRLGRIASDGLLGAFIVYEIASRISPDVTLLLADTERGEVRRYIERYVVQQDE